MVGGSPDPRVSAAPNSRRTVLWLALITLVYTLMLEGGAFRPVEAKFHHIGELAAAWLSLSKALVASSKKAGSGVWRNIGQDGAGNQPPILDDHAHLPSQ